jgi:hypothetical protein
MVKKLVRSFKRRSFRNRRSSRKTKSLRKRGGSLRKTKSLRKRGGSQNESPGYGDDLTGKTSKKLWIAITNSDTADSMVGLSYNTGDVISKVKNYKGDTTGNTKSGHNENKICIDVTCSGHFPSNHIVNLNEVINHRSPTPPHNLSKSYYTPAIDFKARVKKEREFRTENALKYALTQEEHTDIATASLAIFEQEWVAQYDYTAADADELSFKKDDVFTNIVFWEDGRVKGTRKMGEKRGERGVFPSNSVAKVDA